MVDISPEWMTRIEQALVKTHRMPPVEELLAFPWHTVQEGLRETWGLPGLELSSSHGGWKEADQYLRGMGLRPCVMPIHIGKVEECVFLILPEEDIEALTSTALISGSFDYAPMGPRLRQGFYQFLLLKALHVVAQTGCLQPLPLYLASSPVLPQSRGYVIDISCAFSHRDIRARLVCPEPCLEGIKRSVSFRKESLNSLVATFVEPLNLTPVIGYTSLLQEEWDSVQVGDFVTLDRCFFEPAAHKGSVSVCLGDTALFMARIKPEGLKVLDLGLYVEASPDVPDPSRVSLRATVGSFELPLQQLLHLTAEEMLNVFLKPEEGVLVMHNDVVVGRAEVLSLGDVRGLRLLEIVRS